MEEWKGAEQPEGCLHAACKERPNQDVETPDMCIICTHNPCSSPGPKGSPARTCACYTNDQSSTRICSQEEQGKVSGTVGAEGRCMDGAQMLSKCMLVCRTPNLLLRPAGSPATVGVFHLHPAVVIAAGGTGAVASEMLQHSERVGAGDGREMVGRWVDTWGRRQRQCRTPGQGQVWFTRGAIGRPRLHAGPARWSQHTAANTAITHHRGALLKGAAPVLLLVAGLQKCVGERQHRREGRHGNGQGVLAGCCLAPQHCAELLHRYQAAAAGGQLGH